MIAIWQKRQKYVKIRVLGVKILSKSAQNTLFPCSDHFFEVCIGFPIEFWLKKVYKLDFENFEIFGHSNLVLQI